jgi:hypothetical protein
MISLKENFKKIEYKILGMLQIVPIIILNSLIHYFPL